jgi:L-asparaginase
MKKSHVLLIKTGGTIGMKQNYNGEYEPCFDDYLPRVEGLEKLAHLDVEDMGNIDSTNMETNLAFANSTVEQKTKDRAALARLIYNNAFKYDGFVVVHGTDTMAETAAALTYMLPDFKKPIVLTGAQRSIWEPRSDGQNNIYTAVQTATKDYGEVVIAFGNYVLRGSRSRKYNEEKYDSFDTSDLEPLGKITSLKEGIRIAEHRVKRGDFDPRLFTDFDTRIFNYSLVSGATIDEDLITIAESKHNHGILLGGFGAGNVPERLLPFIRVARDHEKPVYVYTKCDTGAADMGIYTVGSAPLEVGAQPAGDMTLEALGQKIMYALGRAFHEKLVGEERLRLVESIIKKPYNGDITVTRRRK